MTVIKSPESAVSSLDRLPSYDFVHFNEQSPELVDVARGIHASCYNRMDFVKPGAISVDGFFADGIDKARGDNVEFAIGYPSGSGPLDGSTERRGSYRVVSVTSALGLHALPSYELCLPNISKQGHRLLEKDVPKTREIAALSGEDKGSIFYMLREAIARGMPNEERWFFGIVQSTFNSLENTFGRGAIKQIGEPTIIPDARVSDHIRIVPAIIDTASFPSTLAKNLIHEKNKKVRERIAGSLLFLEQGLGRESLDLRTNVTLSGIHGIDITRGMARSLVEKIGDLKNSMRVVR